MFYFWQDLRYLQEESTRRKASYLSELRSKDEELEAARRSLADNREEESRQEVGNH